MLSSRKLSDEQINEAKRLRSEGASLKKIGDRYSVHWTTIFLWTTDEGYRKKKLMYKPKDACHKCYMSIKVHPRCKNCTVLIHGYCDCTQEKRYSLLQRY